MKIRILPNIKDYILRYHWEDRMYNFIDKVYDVESEGILKANGEKCYIIKAGILKWYIPESCAEIVDNEKEETEKIKWYSKGKLEESRIITKFKIFENKILPIGTSEDDPYGEENWTDMKFPPILLSDDDINTLKNNGYSIITNKEDDNRSQKILYVNNIYSGNIQITKCRLPFQYNNEKCYYWGVKISVNRDTKRVRREHLIDCINELEKNDN